MDNLILLIEIIAWPLAILTLVALFLFLFRKEIFKVNVDKEFIKYVYEDAYKAPEAVRSILKEEGLTGKQVAKCMRKRDKYLDKKCK